MGDTSPPFFIPCQDIRLEGVLTVHEDARGCAVITHPHPLFGGNMDNPVVRAIQGACFKAGFTTLRFNFRGTGQSSGEFEDGDGEQDDVRACLDYLDQRFGLPILLAGYSFGSWVNARLLDKGRGIQDHIMVSPPVAFLSFSDINRIPFTRLVITGELDDISPPTEVRTMISRCCRSSLFKVLSGADHFYSPAHLQTLSHTLLQHLSA